jgi:hypothetical protein
MVMAVSVSFCESPYPALSLATESEGSCDHFGGMGIVTGYVFFRYATRCEYLYVYMLPHANVLIYTRL